MTTALTHLRRQEFKPQPAAGEWVGLFDRGSLVPREVVICCPQCSCLKKRSVDNAVPAMRLDTPEHFKCSNCGFDSVLIYDDPQYPYIGYSYPETGLGEFGSEYIMWMYVGPPARWWRTGLTARDHKPAPPPIDVGYSDDNDTDMIRKARAGSVIGNWHDMGDTVAEKSAQTGGIL